MLHTLGTTKGRKNNPSIAHCGISQGDKKGKVGIIMKKIKTTPNHVAMMCLPLSCVHGVSTLQIVSLSVSIHAFPLKHKHDEHKLAVEEGGRISQGDVTRGTGSQGQATLTGS